MGEKKNTGDSQRQALYRKYRSRSLDEVVGQEHITKTLAQAIEKGKISHAYLFTGPRGTGKTSVARILAHAINKLPYTDDSTHLDIIEIDAASNRRIDDVRDLRDKVHIAPLSAPYKVYIIDEVHMLTSESFNALLKTLEEPPRHVIFILATTEMHKLPATIISRTQRHSFRLIPQEKIITHLAHIAKEEGMTIDQEALQLLAEHGGGSFRDSISLLDQMAATNEPVTVETVTLLLGLAPKDQIRSLLHAIDAYDTKTVLAITDDILANGVTPAAFASQMIPSIRERVASGGSERLVRMMHELLDVAGSHYPRMKLEAILLSHSINHNTSSTTAIQPAVATRPPEVSTKEIPKKEPPAIVNQEKEVPQKPAPQEEIVTPEKQTNSQKKIPAESSDIITQWPAILAAVRTANNPLYTILRLATPRLVGEELHLAFQFPFHQKRVDDTKYKTLLSATIAELTGADVTIVCIIDKHATPPTEDNSAHASHLAAIQDIMGGGEIVHG